MPETTDIFEVMRTMRAMRRLKPDPVPDELINKILQAAQWAPSGGNTQRWRFLVVKDPEIKKRVQAYYKRLYDETVGPRYPSSAPPPGSDPARYRRQHAAARIPDRPLPTRRQRGSSPASRSARTRAARPAVDLSGGAEHAPGDARARSRYDADDAAYRLRGRGRRDLRPAARRPFPCDPADRLADGPVRAVGPRAAGRSRMSSIRTSGANPTRGFEP